MSGNDVVEIGYGPAGQTQAALLGGAGHRVPVFERHLGFYVLLRAGHLDREIMRPQGSLPSECQDRARLGCRRTCRSPGHVQIQLERMRAGPDGAVRRVL
jgi:hypothetical protein